MTFSKGIAGITGGNRGLGFETARQLGRRGYFIVAGAPTLEKSQDTVRRLESEGFNATAVALDVTKVKDVEAVADLINREFRQFDILVNNAGVMPDRESGAKGVLESSEACLMEALETNLIGAFRVTRLLAPYLRSGGRIVNLSSRMGQLSDMGPGYPAYRISKAAMNGLTRTLAAELNNRHILVNSVCPGWARTDMGGVGAMKTVEEGADTIVWAATLPPDGPTGKFFGEREEMQW